MSTGTAARAATIGMFDGVHAGHRHLIAELCSVAGLRGMHTAAFTFDRHPLEIIAPEKSPKVLTTIAQKAELLVDQGVHEVFVLVFNKAMRELSAADCMRMLYHSYQVRLLLLGFNHRFGHDTSLTTADYVRIGREIGMEVLTCSEFNGAGCPVSSSAIRLLIENGSVREANRMLGHPFTIHGTVEHGNSIGHTIGFPTANVRPVHPRQIVPRCGVYAAIATLGPGQRYKAVVNVGTNPTINDPTITAPRIEAHILDFDGDIYGMPVQLQFVDRIRDEQRFADTIRLRQQIDLDCKEALNILQNDY